jgi:hypothetical protein
VTLDELRREFEEVTIGPLIWGLVLEFSGSVAHRYPPAIYNAGAPWNGPAIEELAQDVVADCLLGEGQLRYLFDVADGLESFRRLMVRQVKRALYRRRRTSVVDRLLKRIRIITAEAPFRVEPIGRERWITSAASPLPLRSLDESELRGAASAVCDVPRLAETGAPGRASMVYTTSHLVELVERLMDRTGGLTESDFSKILEILLTAWLPTFLDDTEGDQIPTLEAADSGLDYSNLVETVKEFTETLDESDRVVLLFKSQGLSDSAVAARVGRSRPWVADRKREVLARVESGLMNDVDPPHHSLAARMLLAEVSVRMEANPDVAP